MKTILFDLDGTLIDSTEAIVEGFFVAFDTLGIKRALQKDICSLIGYPLDMMFLKLGLKESIISEAVKHYKDHYRKISTQKTALLPDAKKSIELASTFGKLGIVTTKTAQYSKELLDYFDLLQHFEVVIGRENVENPKPHSEPILKALETLCVNPNQNVYMIGDTCLDMQAAKNAKIVGIGVLCGYGTKEQLSKCTKYLQKTTFEAVKYIQNSNQNLQ